MKRSHHIGGKGKSKLEVGIRLRVDSRVLMGSADEIPFAPSEMLVHGDEVSAGNFFDEFGLAEPLLVGAALVMGHGGEGVHLAGNSSHGREFGNKVHESQKGRSPRFDEHDTAIFSQDALHFRESLIEIARQGGEMVQTALNNQDVLAAIREGKLAAISKRAFRGALELPQEARREVHALDAGEAEALKSHQAVSAAAKKLDDLGVARPLRRAQSIEARDKFLNFLLGRFEAQIRGFPRIRDKLARRVCFQSVGRIFHL